MTEIINDEKVYFTPGQLVKLRLDIPNKPVMMVVRIERSIIRLGENKPLKGVKCRWFTDNGFLQEAVFSTKDLLLIDEK